MRLRLLSCQTSSEFLTINLYVSVYLLRKCSQKWRLLQGEHHNGEFSTLKSIGSGAANHNRARVPAGWGAEVSHSLHGAVMAQLYGSSRRVHGIGGNAARADRECDRPVK